MYILSFTFLSTYLYLQYNQGFGYLKEQLSISLSNNSETNYKHLTSELKQDFFLLNWLIYEKIKHTGCAFV